MGQPALVKFLDKTLKNIDKSAGGQGRRKEVNRLKGQLFAISKNTIDTETENIAKSFGTKNLSSSEMNSLKTKAWIAIKKVLKDTERRNKQYLSTRRFNQLNKKRLSTKFRNKIGLRGPSAIYIITQYGVISDSKSRERGALRLALTEVFKEFFSEVDDNIIGERIGGKAKGKGSVDSLTGYNLGHGEYGAPVIGVTAGSIKADLDRNQSLTKEQKERVNKVFEDPKYANLKLNILHTNHFTKNGKLRKDYVLVLSLQSAKENLEDASQSIGDNLSEADLQRELIRDVTSLKNLVEGEGSTPIGEMVRQSILKSLTRSKYVRGNKNTKENFKETSRGENKKRLKYQPKGETVITSGSLMNSIKKRDIAPKPSTKKSRQQQTSPLYLLKQINARLPQKVSENMEPPALENRTGRFAASVRAVDVNRTRMGYPSIGYTYQKNPYQIYETSTGKRPWSSLERDPRTLIDRSIREIAAELQLGRFYTRRV